MRTPESLRSLVEYGIVDEVIRPLMSGKEAQIYLVVAGGEERVAKIYKEAQERSFKHRAEYTEGRKTRNSRDQRAMGKHTRHGRAQDEAAWRSAEVDAIYRLQAAGVRVPVPYNFVDGVLVMELVKDDAGLPAPRLGDLSFQPDEARRIHDHLLGEVVRMLCAGVVHGDLSDFNVLMAADGPVIIDFPQAVDAARNQSARKLLLRDVDNLHRFLARFVPGRPRPFAQEMWDLYQSNLLTPDTRLIGRHAPSSRPADTADVLALIGEADRDAQRRRAALTPSRGRKVEVIITPPRRASGPTDARAPRASTSTSAQARAADPRDPRATTPSPVRANIDRRAEPRADARGPRPGAAPKPRTSRQRPDAPANAPRGPQPRGNVEDRAPAQASAPRPTDDASASPPSGGGRTRARRRRRDDAATSGRGRR